MINENQGCSNQLDSVFLLQGGQAFLTPLSLALLAATQAVFLWWRT